MSSVADATPSLTYDGERVEALAERWQLPRVVAYDAIGSTLDVAHTIAEAAGSGTLVLADEQTAGRGRQGRKWTSASGAGVWLTLIERPADPRALDVLALRCGLFAAEALESFASAPIGVKWPNDLYVGERKLAGILIETRWRGAAPEWVAIGFGLNVRQPDVPTAIGLAPATTRLAALDVLVPALRNAAAAPGLLTASELSRWRARDIAAGRGALTPGEGTVQGISSAGEILITNAGVTTSHRSGSLTFAEPLACS